MDFRATCQSFPAIFYHSSLPTASRKPFLIGFAFYNSLTENPKMDLLTHLAQQPAPAPGGGLTPILFFILLFAGMWFLIIAPQRKRQKQQEAMIKALQTGDKVLTSGGVYGEITNVKDDRITVKIADGVKVEMARAYVANKVQDPS